MPPLYERVATEFTDQIRRLFGEHSMKESAIRGPQSPSMRALVWSPNEEVAAFVPAVK
jgi:hypothetical protein